MKTSELKERLQAVIDMYPDGTRGAGMRNTLIAILADLDAEPPKPTPEKQDTPRNEKEFCRECANRSGCDDYILGRIHACSDFGFEREDIPKPTGEQLKAIGKVLDGDAPRECTEGDLVFMETGYSLRVGWGDPIIGKLFRWHLKDAPAPKSNAAVVLEGLRKLGQPEPPKPTAEPDAMAIIKQALTDYADVFVDLIVERLKDAPEQPAQMICNHAGECKADCEHKVKHSKCAECESPAGDTCPLPLAVCVPWVEPVVHTSCEGCVHKGINFFMCGGCFNHMETMSNQEHRNYTPAQPEPAAPDSDILDDGHGSQWSAWCPTCGHKTMVIVRPGKVQCNSDECNQPEPAAPDRCKCNNRPCSTCGWMSGPACQCLIACLGGNQWKPKEPEAAPGLAMTMRQEIENMIVYLRTSAHTEFKRKNVIACCKEILKCKG